MKKENKEITITELNEIQKEIRENKEKSLIKKMDKFKLILTNILIAIATIIYLWIIVGIANNVTTIILMSNLKKMITIEIIAVIIFFEISIRKNEKNLFIHSIECFIITAFTMLLYGLYGRENPNIRYYILVMVMIIFIYYSAKSLIINFKKY